MSLSHLKLCFLVQMDYPSLEHCLQCLRDAIAGGVTSVQLRDKTGSITHLRSTAQAIKYLLDDLGIPLIINDFVELAADLDAAGVHLGQSDVCPSVARRILGPEKIIGWSIDCLEDLHRANQLNCIDYIGAGAVFPTHSKPDCKTIWGLKGLQQICHDSKHPVVAIGGINAGNAREVMRQGPCGIAVISALREHSQPFDAAHELIQEIKNV